MPGTPWDDSNGWLTCVVFESARTRDHVQKSLEAQDIESRPLWKPMHMQPVFREAQVCRGSVAAGLFETGLCLPSGSNLTAADQQRVTSALHQLHTAATTACVRA